MHAWHDTISAIFTNFVNDLNNVQCSFAKLDRTFTSKLQING
jgi:hypothetical protein